MKRGSIIIAGVIAIIIVAALIACFGCNCLRHSHTMYGIRVAADGTGGAYAVYEDELGGLVYAQKISKDGKVEWGSQGFSIGNSHLQSTYAFSYTSIINSDTEGAIIALPSTRSSQQPEPTSWIIKLNQSGGVDYNWLFVRVGQMVSDGSGGVILDYSSDEKSLYVAGIDSRGNFPWGRDGVLLSNQGNAYQIAADGLGGVVIAREELRYPEDARPGETFSRHYIYTHRIGPEGYSQWKNEGILLYSTAEDVFAESVQVIGDGAGGAIIAWLQHPRGRIESGSAEALKMDIFLQKVAADGSVLWREGGLPLGITMAEGDAFPAEPRLVGDGSGGAIVIWRDARAGTGVYTQRVDADGTIRWQAGGVKVASTSLNPFPQIVEDGAGGAIVSYARDDGLCMQKVNGNGETLWGENGVALIEGDYDGYSLAADGQGGAIAGWGVGRGLFRGERAYIQRVSSEGELLWGRKGIRLNR